MTAQIIKRPATAKKRAAAKRGPGQADKFASLTADLLGRDETRVITRSDVKRYDHEALKSNRLEPQKVAVTFRMQPQEFVRLRKGADKIGVKPRDIVHRAIKNCLDAYGVSPSPDLDAAAGAAETRPAPPKRAAPRPSDATSSGDRARSAAQRRKRRARPPLAESQR